MTYFRIRTFEANHKFVADTNAQNQLNGSDLRLEINLYSDMN